MKIERMDFYFLITFMAITKENKSKGVPLHVIERLWPKFIYVAILASSEK